MNDNKRGPLRTLRAVVSLILVALYAAGLVAMLTSSFQLGLILWVVSTLGGIGLLYWIHVTDKRRRTLEEPREGDRP